MFIDASYYTGGESKSMSEDVFVALRRFCWDFGYTKTMKKITKVSLRFSISLLMLQIYLIWTNPNIQFTQYCAFLFAILYGIVSTLFSVLYETTLTTTLRSLHSLGWSADSMDGKIKSFKRRETGIKTFLYATGFLSFAFVLTANLPIWGFFNQVDLIGEMCYLYFENFSTIGQTIYFVTALPLYYAAIRLPLMFLYVALHVEKQTFLLNARISNIGLEDHLEQFEDSDFQRETEKRLVMCVQQHVRIKALLKQSFERFKMAMPPLLLSGVLACFGIMVFVLLHWKEIHIANKMRVFSFVLFTGWVLVSFCHAGQLILDQSSEIFSTLSNCNWYCWNGQNKQHLLMFLANSLIPFSVIFAGIMVDRRLFLAICQYAFTNALVLYNLNRH